MKRLTVNQFIEKAQKIHENRYDYSKVDYKNNKSKVIIVCKIHGSFMQVVMDHLKGRGCPKCNGGVNLGLELFVDRAIIIHGDKYSYKKTDYKKAKEKIMITCLKHGDFWQRPSSHLEGYGCLKCGGAEKLNTKQFIERAIKIHSNKYDYSKVNYLNSYSKIKIICPEHDEFEQMPHHHLEGHGCSMCGILFSRIKQVFTTEQYVKKAEKTHNYKYDYSNVIYKNAKSKISIICKKHGEFKQRASTHLEGQGCPTCRKSKGEIKIEKWLMANKILYIPQKRFPECRGSKYPLPFDFYLPDYNMCIEFDGPQHYCKSFFFCNDVEERELKFKQTVENDKIKTEFCTKNNIELIRIRHKESLTKLYKLVA